MQTLFYGVFSAWVLWHRSHPRPRRALRLGEGRRSYLHVPILRKLFREWPTRSSWTNGSLAEVLDWTAGVLNRVDRAAFFAKFQDAEAVQYFYEPFLEAFDPELRKQLGVWYTPPEIVRYMVARVDAVLREDLGRPDGLADPDVYVLDPCCGTGAYLVEVLRTIAATLRDKGEDALLGGQLKEAATERVFGFEILPAPFVVAHLQLGLFLQARGRAAGRGQEGAGRRLPDQRPDRLGAAEGAEAAVCCSRKWRRSTTRPSTVKQQQADPGGARQPAVQRLRRRRRRGGSATCPTPTAEGGDPATSSRRARG